MKTGPMIVIAVSAGYLLGRTKKAKLAVGVGLLLAGRRMQTNPLELAQRGLSAAQKNERFAALTDRVSGDLADAGKTLGFAMAERWLRGLTDRLQPSASSEETSGDEPPEDEAPEHENAEDEASEDEASGDENPDDENPEDEASDDEASDDENPDDENPDDESAHGDEPADEEKEPKPTAKRSSRSRSRKSSSTGTRRSSKG